MTGIIRMVMAVMVVVVVVMRDAHLAHMAHQDWNKNATTINPSTQIQKCQNSNMPEEIIFGGQFVQSTLIA